MMYINYPLPMPGSRPQMVYRKPQAAQRELHSVDTSLDRRCLAQAKRRREGHSMGSENRTRLDVCLLIHKHAFFQGLASGITGAPVCAAFVCQIYRKGVDECGMQGDS